MNKKIIFIFGMLILVFSFGNVLAIANFNISSSISSNPLFFINGTTGDASFGFNVTAVEDFCLTSGLCLSSLELGNLNGTFNSVAWNRSGTNVFLANDGDNVGIGTTSPSAKLHINGTSVDGNDLLRFGLDGGRDWIFEQYGSDAGTHLRLLSTQSKDFYLDMNEFYVRDTSGTNTTLYVNPSIGNVGIGTTSPSEKLEIYGDTPILNFDPSVNNGEGIIQWNDHNWQIRGRASEAPFTRSLVTGRVMSITSGAADSEGFAFGRYGGSSIFEIQNDGIIYMNGNVGIGTTSPLQKLHVNGNILANGTINATTDVCIEGGECLSTISASGLGAVTGSGTAWYIPMWNGTMSLNNSPVYTDGTNVGIGTDSPDTTFQISHSEGGNLSLYRQDTSIFDGDVLGSLQFGGADDGWINSEIGGEIRYVANGTQSNWAPRGRLEFRTSYASAQNATTRMVVDWLGNVGIGTTAPSRLFHVNSSANNYIRLQATGADTYAGYEMTNDAQGWTTGVNNNDDYVISDGLQFGGDSIVTIQNGAPANMLYIKDTGNVGIGTTSPSVKLEVADNGDSEIKLLDTNTNEYTLLTQNSGDGDFEINRLGTGGVDLSIKPSGDLIIGQQGNVGIGTTSPSQKLDVAGNINIAEGYSYLYDGEQALRLAKGQDTFYANTFVGKNAGNSSAFRQTAVGYYAGSSSSGNDQTALGFQAGNVNSGNQQTVVGHYAGRENTGSYETAMGYFAGYKNTGNYLTAIGGNAGYNNSGLSSNFIGRDSGYLNIGDRIIGIGYQATRENTADDVIAIGYQAGYQNTASNKFIVKQNNVNTTNLIYGDFVTGQVNASDFCTYGGECLSNVVQSAGNVSGSGTLNYLPKWTPDGSSLGNSQIYDDGTNVGINKSSPEATLHVGGDVIIEI